MWDVSCVNIWHWNCVKHVEQVKKQSIQLLSCLNCCICFEQIARFKRRISTFKRYLNGTKKQPSDSKCVLEGVCCFSLLIIDTYEGGIQKVFGTNRGESTAYKGIEKLWLRRICVKGRHRWRVSSTVRSSCSF